MNTLKYFLLATMLVFAGCAEDGGPGPKGEQGEPGPQGGQGEQGPQGEKGDKGTANVVASTWIRYNWNEINTATNKRMKYQIPDEFWGQIGFNNLFQFYDAGGILLIYGSPRNELFDFEFRNAEHTYYSLGGDEIYLHIQSIDGSALRDIDISNEFRFIMIPAGVQLNGRTSADQANFQDYHAVCQYYGIPE